MRHHNEFDGLIWYVDLDDACADSDCTKAHVHVFTDDELDVMAAKVGTLVGNYVGDYPHLISVVEREVRRIFGELPS